jgi:hypothetical protein
MPGSKKNGRNSTTAAASSKSAVPGAAGKTRSFSGNGDDGSFRGIMPFLEEDIQLINDEPEDPFTRSSEDAEDEIELALKLLGYEGSTVGLEAMKGLLCPGGGGGDSAAGEGPPGFTLSPEEWSALSGRMDTTNKSVSRDELITELVHEPTALPNMEDVQASPTKQSLKA